MNENKVIVIGAGGHAKVVIDILKLCEFEIIGILDDNTLIHQQDIAGVSILGGNEKLDELLDLGITKAFVAIGNNTVRIRIGEDLQEKGFSLVKAIHPKSIIASSVQIGDGSMIAAGVCINPETSIGSHSIINTGATIDHDCYISDGVHVSPGANLAGNVRVGERTHIGIGSCVIQGKIIAENTIIGAGSVVISDIEAGVVAFGVPAKVSRQLQIT